MARRQAIAWLRSGTHNDRDGKSLSGAEVLEHPGAPPQEGSEAKHRHAIQEALASIHPRQRAAIELAYFSGMTHGELADHLAVPTGSVRESIRLGMARQVLSSGKD